MFVIFMFVTAISLVLPIVSNLFLMILAYLGQTPEVPRTDLRAKHHS